MVGLVTPRRIAIIPARGGSKRIPGKNIIDFRGRPMIAWTIEAALRTGLFAHVLVSTDDRRIAEVAVKAGAKVPFLRGEAADDMSPASAATLAALHQACTHWNEEFDTVVQLMPNCPLRDAADIAAALEHFEVLGRTFQISCFRFGWMNPWWAATIDADGHPAWIFGDRHNSNSQDLPALYCPSGAVWIASATELRKSGTFYGPGHVFEPLDWMSAVDIDEADDLRMALAVARIKGTG